MRNEAVRTASIYVGYLIVIVIGIMVGKDMLDKPFTISHVADFYTSFPIYGTAISLGFSPRGELASGSKDTDLACTCSSEPDLSIHAVGGISERVFYFGK